MTTTNPDALIVGAGPVGTALAIDLTRRGLSVRIIDKADHGFDGSRAKGIQPRTLEVLDDLGALEDVLAGGSTYPLMGIHLGPAGIGFIGSTDEADRILIVDVTVRGGLSRKRWHVWPGMRGRFIGACPLPHADQFQWMIRLAPEETPPPDEEQITHCVRARTGNKRLSVHDITWKSVFRPNIRIAESFRSGRVFIVGDAAHAHTPAGAQGLNTGIQDSYNLGWKLAQVLAGAPPELLDTYEAERQPIAAAVLGLSTKKYAGLGKLDPSSIKRGQDEQQLALSYRGGPLAPSTATLHVGDRVPDAQLQDNDGTSVQLFDAYRGPHFTAVAYGPHAARELDLLLWPTDGASLRRVAIDAESRLADRVFDDPIGSFRRNYGLQGDAVLLIRPDGYIASIATHDMLATMQAAGQAMTPALSEKTA